MDGSGSDHRCCSAGSRVLRRLEDATLVALLLLLPGASAAAASDGFCNPDRWPSWHSSGRSCLTADADYHRQGALSGELGSLPNQILGHIESVSGLQQSERSEHSEKHVTSGAGAAVLQACYGLSPEELGLKTFDARMSSALNDLQSLCGDLQDLADEYLAGGLHTELSISAPPNASGTGAGRPWMIIAPFCPCRRRYRVLDQSS